MTDRASKSGESNGAERAAGESVFASEVSTLRLDLAPDEDASEPDDDLEATVPLDLSQRPPEPDIDPPLPSPTPDERRLSEAETEALDLSQRDRVLAESKAGAKAVAPTSTSSSTPNSPRPKTDGGTDATPSAGRGFSPNSPWVVSALFALGLLIGWWLFR